MQDRQYWIPTLEKIARPVLSALAQGRLKATMPMEFNRALSSDRHESTHLEAMSRLLTGIAPRLELPADDTPYISTGSLYLCATGLLPLGLPITDEFWTANAMDWSSRQVYAGLPVSADHAFGSALVDVEQGTQEINLPLILASNTTFEVASGATLIIASPMVIDPGVTLTQIGPGSVVYQSTVTVGTGGSITYSSAPALPVQTLTASTAPVITVPTTTAAANNHHVVHQSFRAITSAAPRLAVPVFNDAVSTSGISTDLATLGNANFDGALFASDFSLADLWLNYLTGWSNDSMFNIYKDQ